MTATLTLPALNTLAFTSYDAKTFAVAVNVNGHDVLFSYTLMFNGDLLHYDVLDTAFRPEVLGEARHAMRLFMVEGYPHDEEFASDF